MEDANSGRLSLPIFYSLKKKKDHHWLRNPKLKIQILETWKKEQSDEDIYGLKTCNA